MGRLRSVDTNVLARYVMRDEPRQAAIADTILQEPFFVTYTVLLETAWVLSSYYRMGRQDLAKTLRDLVELPTFSVADRKAVTWAVDRFAQGADFADMMHIAGSRDLDSFVSFETRLVKLAGPDTPVPVERLS